MHYFILEVVESGYKFHFDTVPEVAALTQNESATKNSDFVWKAIRELLCSERIREVPQPPVVTKPLSVSVQANGKKQLILDLRYVNKHLVKHHFKYEDLKTGLAHFERGRYMFLFDLKSVYHHIKIHPFNQQFLGFSWACPSTG